MTATVRRSNKMNPKVAASFTIVLTLAMILSANPAMTMPSSIFGSSSDDGGSSSDDGGSSSDDGGSSSDGNDGSSETEQPEVESETGVTKEGTEPELVDCPDGSQAAMTEICPTAPATTDLVDCPDGSQAATLAECPAVPAVPTLAPYKTLFCRENPTSPECNITPTTSTTTEIVVPINPDGTCPAGSHIVGYGGKTGSNAPSGSKCVADNDQPTPSRQYNCIAEQVSSELPTCGTNVENDPNYYCAKFTLGEAAGQTRCTRASLYITDPCWDDPKSFACANKIEFCNGHPTDIKCEVQTRPPVAPQYNCIAEQASSKYPTCPGGVENDPSYVCFEQVGQTICSRGAYDPCVESLVSPACKLKYDFCNSNPTDPRQLCKRP
jgi:hypothetical protein